MQPQLDAVQTSNALPMQLCLFEVKAALAAHTAAVAVLQASYACKVHRCDSHIATLATTIQLVKSGKLVPCQLHTPGVQPEKMEILKVFKTHNALQPLQQ